MSGDYPGEPAGPFPRPPHAFTDEAGREIVVRVAEPTDLADLVAMYADFAPEDRAQGIPPAGEDAIERWLEEICSAECLHAIAWHGDRPVGHALLVGESPPEDAATASPDGGEDAPAFELAIFVHGEYQRDGIGTELLETLLGYATDRGVDRVWLTVERWNDPAIALYQDVGFEIRDTQNFDVEMGIELPASD